MASCFECTSNNYNTYACIEELKKPLCIFLKFLSKKPFGKNENALFLFLIFSLQLVLTIPLFELGKSAENGGSEIDC